MTETHNDTEHKSDLTNPLTCKSAHVSRLVYDLVVPEQKGKSVPMWLLDECNACFDTIFDLSMTTVDLSIRKRLIADMCGIEEQGVVAPTKWPVQT